MGFKRFFIITIIIIAFSILSQPVAAESTGNLSAHVIAADGTPMQNLWVHFFRDGRRVAIVRTDSNGWARATNLATGTYTVDVYGTTRYSKPGLVVTGGATTSVGFQFGLLDIHATTAEGEPLANLLVHFYIGESRVAIVRTDSNGRYKAHVAPGNYTVIAAGLSKGGLEVLPGEIEYVIFGPPDLSISASDITFSDENPPEGEIVNISATIHNIGDADVSDTTVSFYDDDPVNGTLIGTVNSVAITAGGSKTIKIPWIASPAGTHEIHVVVDPGDAVYEISEDNNHAWGEVNVIVSNVAPVAHIFSISPNPRLKVKMSLSLVTARTRTVQ